MWCWGCGVGGVVLGVWCWGVVLGCGVGVWCWGRGVGGEVLGEVCPTDCSLDNSK